MVYDLVEEIRELLVGFVGTPTEEREERLDRQLHAGATTVEALPAGNRGLPKWADQGAVNQRGLVPRSRSHFTALCAVNGAFVEAIVDTGAARSMVDYDTAVALGLPLELATEENSFGSFQGPAGKATQYFGRVSGPVRVQLSREVVFYLPEMKVFRHCEPLMLVGTDILMQSRSGWSFHYVGVDPTTKKGVMTFTHGDRAASVELVHWPQAHFLLPPSGGARTARFAEGTREPRTYPRAPSSSGPVLPPNPSSDQVRSHQRTRPRRAAPPGVVADPASPLQETADIVALIRRGQRLRRP